MAVVRGMSGAADDLGPAAPREPGELLRPVLRAERIPIPAHDEQWTPHPRNLALQGVVHRRTRHADDADRPRGEVVAGNDRQERRRLPERVEHEAGRLPPQGSPPPVDRRPDEDRPFHELRRPNGQLRDHLAAHRVPEHRRPIADDFPQRLGLRLHCCVPPQIGHDTLELRQLANQRKEVPARDAEPVDEDKSPHSAMLLPA